MCEMYCLTVHCERCNMGSINKRSTRVVANFKPPYRKQKMLMNMTGETKNF